MRQGLLRAVVALGVAGVLLSGCSAPVTGTPSPGPGQPVDVPAGRLTITGAAGGSIDTMVRDALVDITTFWSTAYPRFFGRPFTPLAGGYFSVDGSGIDAGAYPPTGIGCRAQPVDPQQTKGNAFYNPRCDAIAYDRSLLTELGRRSGRALPAVVLAHEFGHAMQGRFGFAPAGSSIRDETQADCFAGAWTAWVVAGHAQHVAIRKPELDDVLAGYLTLSDPVGSDPADNQAHGSYFDRVAAFSDGYDKGVAACRDTFGPERVFTDAAFTSAADALQNGNAPYAQAVQLAEKTLPRFWTAVFPKAFGTTFRAPKVRLLPGAAPGCAGGSGRELAFCPAESTVYVDEPDLVRPSYGTIGDWSVATAISLPYALAARAQLGTSTGDAAATGSAVCLTGWYTAQAFDGAFADTLRLSPGDIDEAVRFLLTYGVSDRVFPNTHETGFGLLRSFRDGFVQGGSACGLGI